MTLTSRQVFLTDDDRTLMLLLARWVGMIAERAELAEQVAAGRARRIAVEEVITILAHDLNNHLTPVKGQVDLLRRRA